MCESWASEAARKLKQRDADQVPEQAAMFEKRRLIEEQGPHQWHEICEHIKTMCAELNEEYGKEILVFQIGQSNGLHVLFRRGDALSEARVVCDLSASTDALRWSYSVPEAKAVPAGKYHFDVTNGVVTLRNSIMLSCRESIAKQVLDGLLNVGMEAMPGSGIDPRCHEVVPIFSRRPEANGSHMA